MIDFFQFKSTSIKGLGPIFYTDDWALVEPYKGSEFLATYDCWDLQEREFPQRPWRRKKFPMHSCYHRHLDGVVFIEPSSSNPNLSVVANHAVGGEERVFFKLGSRPLYVAPTGPCEVYWGRFALVCKHRAAGPVNYCHYFSWTNSTGSESSNGRATYRAYAYDEMTRTLIEGPSQALGYMSRSDLLILAGKFEPTEFEGVTYGGVGYEVSLVVSYNDVDPENVAKLAAEMRLGLAGHYPMSRDTDRAMFDTLLDRIRPDRVNLAEFAIGLKDLPSLLKELPEGVLRVIGRRIVSRRGLDGSAQDISEIRDVIGQWGLTAADASGVYLGWLYGLSPLPSDLRSLDQLRDAITRARKEFQVDLRTRKTFSNDEGWLGYQSAQVMLCQQVNRVMPEIDEILDQPNLRVAHGLAFQNGHTLLEDAAARLASMGFPATPAEIALNLWELFPYSFVADWFVGLGDRLEELGNDALWGCLPVDFSCRTVKARKDVTDSVLELAANLNLRVIADMAAYSYDRQYIADRVEYNPYGDGGSLMPSQHWGEGLGLIFVRAGRRSGTQKVPL